MVALQRLLNDNIAYSCKAEVSCWRTARVEQVPKSHKSVVTLKDRKTFTSLCRKWGSGRVRNRLLQCLHLRRNMKPTASRKNLARRRKTDPMATHHHRHPKLVSLARNPAATATQTRVQGRLRCLLPSYTHLFCVSLGFFFIDVFSVNLS